jgi:hypothetical protein
MVHALRDSAGWRRGERGKRKKGETMSTALNSRPPREQLTRRLARPTARGALLTSKGTASLYLMEREPLLRAKFAELYGLLKEIERTNTIGPASSPMWLDYALDKGYYEEWL